VKMKLSAFAIALLRRAVAGEDRQIPERLHEEPGRRAFLVPARRWYVPPGLLVPEGGAEYRSARSLAARGLLKAGGADRSSELPYGLGGYLITIRGRRIVKERAR